MNKFGKKGFTLVELLAVITVVAILSGLAVTNVISSMNNSRKNTFLYDAKRMVSKAEYLLSESKANREQAKSSSVTFNFSKLNSKGEFDVDADGGEFNTNSFVKVTYDNSTNQYKYCICVMGSQRQITNGVSCNYNNGRGCVLSSTLTSINVVNDSTTNDDSE